MEKYEELYLELVYLDDQDVITTSMTGSNGDYNGETPEPGVWG